MRRLFVFGLLSFLSAAMVFGATERSFKLKNRPAVEALPLIEPLLSPNGVLTLRPSKNILVVKDSKENLDNISRFLATWDIALRRFQVQVIMLLSTTGKPSTQPPQGLDRQLFADLAALLPNKSFELLDKVRFVGKDGETLESPAGGHYIIRFTVRADNTDSNRVLLSPFELLRTGGPSGMPDKMPFMSTGSVLYLGQPFIWAVGREISGPRALLLVFLAESEDKK